MTGFAPADRTEALKIARGSSRSMFSAPIPSITGGSSAPALSNTAPTQFGGVTQGGGIGFWGFATIAAVAVIGGVVFLAVRKR